MAEPTKGVWNLGLYPDGAFEITGPTPACDNVGGPVICSRNAWTHNAAESHANACVMYASRELLAACRAAFAFLRERGDPFAGTDWELGHRLSAAIGQAEGELP